MSADALQAETESKRMHKVSGLVDVSGEGICVPGREETDFTEGTVNLQCLLNLVKHVC